VGSIPIARSKNKMNHYTEIPGWTYNRELRILEKLASCVPENGSIVEIGCFLGRSVSALYSGKNESVTLDVIDPFDGKVQYSNLNITNYTASYLLGNESLFIEAQKIANQSDWIQAFKFCVGDEVANNVTLHVMKSNDFKKEKHYDLTFIDGSHFYADVVHDLVKFSTDEGLIIGDDFSKMYPDVVKAVGQFRGAKTLIVFQDTKLFALIPKTGYWNEVFKNNNLMLM